MQVFSLFYLVIYLFLLFIGLLQHNIHFLQEVLQNRRSDLLEWGVIILLTIEIAISMYEIVKDSNIIPS
jgi:uncharacterized Rmd1/YagE family protein